ncbi:MAG: TIGR01906 family membrane protein [Clostridiales bacterium]|nr:TIGR01906 family membrane protein [Clostridiales bacterium]
MHKLLSILLALLMSIGLLAAAIYLPATANWVMRPLMEHYAPPEDTHLPAEEYAPVADMITRYLKGGNDAFQHVFTVDGTEYAAFNQKEQHHMADVQDLFRLCRFVAWLGWGIVILGGLSARRNLDWRPFRRTLIAILAAVTVIVILACIDFDSLFVLFHKVAFTNDLWLLDPRTDLLIRLMPIEFFISYAAIIGGIWLLGMAAMLVISTIRIKKMQDKGE